jgi:hypothetical protein
MGQAYRNSQARNIDISPDGKTLYVTGQTGATFHYGYLTVAYNAATGAARWFTRYNGRANRSDYANTGVVAPDGKAVYVTGGSRGRSSGTDFATVAYNAATGAQRWAARYDGPGNALDAGGSLAITPNGRTVIAGPSLGPNSGPGSLTGYATVAYNAASGAPFWTRRALGFPGISTLYSQTLAISPDGSTVYVTGNNAVGCCDFDYATVAYAFATGAKQWLSRYNGPGNKSDQASALALSLDGSTLYVTGVSDRVSSGGFATIAYQPEPEMRGRSRAHQMSRAVPAPCRYWPATTPGCWRPPSSPAARCSPAAPIPYGGTSPPR